MPHFCRTLFGKILMHDYLSLDLVYKFIEKRTRFKLPNRRKIPSIEHTSD